MKVVSKLALTAAGLALAPGAACWGIGWYVGVDCAEDAGPNAYYGLGSSEKMSGLLLPGEPGTADDNCEWREDNGTGFQPCTSAMNPAAQTFALANDTICGIGPQGAEIDISFNTLFGQEVWNECVNVLQIPGLFSEIYGRVPVYFYCYRTNDATDDS